MLHIMAICFDRAPEPRAEHRVGHRRVSLRNCSNEEHSRKQNEVEADDELGDGTEKANDKPEDDG